MAQRPHSWVCESGIGLRLVSMSLQRLTERYQDLLVGRKPDAQAVMLRGNKKSAF